MMTHFGLSIQKQGSPEAPRASVGASGEPQEITKTGNYYSGEQPSIRSL